MVFEQTNKQGDTRCDANQQRAICVPLCTFFQELVILILNTHSLLRGHRNLDARHRRRESQRRVFHKSVRRPTRQRGQQCRAELGWPSHSSSFCWRRSSQSESTQTSSHSTRCPLASSTKAHGQLATTSECRSAAPKHSPSSGAVRSHRLEHSYPRVLLLLTIVSPILRNWHPCSG